MADTGTRHHLPSGASRRILAEWPILAVSGVAGFGLFLMLGGHIVVGPVVMGASLFLAAVLRLVLSKRAAGTLVIRRRVIDVGIYCFLGFLLILLGLLVQGAFSS